MTKEEFKAYMLADDFFNSDPAGIETILRGIEGPGVYGINTEYGDYCVNETEFETIAAAKTYSDMEHAQDSQWMEDQFDWSLPVVEQNELFDKLMALVPDNIAANPYPKSNDFKAAAYYWGDFNEVVDGKLVYPDILYGEGWFLVSIN